ncbi:MAG: hypothetical protein CML06_00455 [Pseudomonadales bacterium]|nr:hypothetical protein [Pseudomonadales bacterium]
MWLPAVLLGVIWLPAQAQLNIEVNGVDGELKTNVRLHLSRWDSLPRGDDDQIRRQIQNRVRKALQPFGYYQPEIDARWQEGTIQVDIGKGPPIRWQPARVDIQPAQLDLPQAAAELVNKPPFQPGDILRHQIYEDYKKRLLLTMRQAGFLDANWQTSRLHIDVEAGTAQARLVMSAGERYRIHKIRIVGTDLAEDTIQTLLTINEGDWYSTNAVGKLYENLLSTGYYANASVDLNTEPPNRAIVTVSLTEKAKDQFTTGIGYGTDTGARAKLGWTRSRVNDRGDDIYSNIQVSQIGQEVTFQYHIPWPHPLKRYLSWDTGWKHEETTDRESTLLSTGLSLKRIEQQHWQYSVGVNLEHENYQQGDNPDETITYALPNFHYIRRQLFTRPDATESTLKYWFDTSLGFSLLEDHTLFWSVLGGASLVHELNHTHSLATRVELGAIMTGDFYAVPLSKRFYVGGDQTVRGFRYNTLAPEDEDGELVGGQFMNVFSLEYRYRLTENWQAATFVDTGRSYISSHAPFHSGAGIGVRWMLPVGTFSFDIAKPITGEDDSSIRFHLYLGMVL